MEKIKKEIFINISSGSIRIAITEDENLVEIFIKACRSF